MKILILFPSELRGGAEEYALTVARYALFQDNETHVSFPCLEATDSLRNDFLKHGIHYHPLAHSYEPLVSFAIPTKGPLYLLSVLNLLNKIRPNIMMIILSSPDRCLVPIMASALKNIPAALIFQLVPPDFPPCSPYRKFLYKLARGRGQKWVAISDNNRAILHRSFGLPESEIARIYNGSKMSEVDAQSGDMDCLRRAVRRELRIPETGLILLTVGRLHSQKGYDALIQIVSDITMKHQECIFVWVGDGELREYLERTIRTNELVEKILLLGHRVDVERLMRASDLFLFPSRYEGGQSFVITEAMANGLPIISTNASGISEVITHGVHGLLSDVDDMDGFQENVDWALNNRDKMNVMSQNASKHVVNFSEKRMLDETFQLIQNLCNTHNIKSKGNK